MGKRQAWWGRLLAGVCLVTTACADDIRSWTDADGVVHFGDKYAAPEQSRPVALGEGTFLDMETPPPPVNAPPSAAPADTPPPDSTTRSRPCTPLLQAVVDPVSGMHSQRDTGRCQEDEPVPGVIDAYPVHVPPCTVQGAKPSAGCVRPHPRPPVTPPATKPVSPATPRPFNQSPVDFSR